MRRKEREIKDIEEIESIIQQSSVCRLGLSENNNPYVVPLCFGYQDKTLYFHSATEGQKIQMIRSNNHVCFEIDIECELVEARKACGWGMRFLSVIGFGKACIIEDAAEKRSAFDIIMRHYSDESYEYPDDAIQACVIIKVSIESMAGKKSGR